MAKTNNSVKISNNYNDILEYYSSTFGSVEDYLKDNSSSRYLLIHKIITYADVISRGKRTEKSQPHCNDVLTYLSEEDFKKLDLGITKQSNICMPKCFYEELGVQQLERRKGQQSTQHKHILLNDFAKVFLVSESITYFQEKYTKIIFKALKRAKDLKWKNINLEKDTFIEMDLHHAIHGIGTDKDEMFFEIRKNVFRNDTIDCLIETKSNGEKTLFISFQKNPSFFTLAQITNNDWEKYLTKEAQKKEYKLKGLEEDVSFIEEETKRKHQAKWRRMLAEEVMNYTVNDGEVFCAFTGLKTDFEQLGTLFVASHIKAYAKCEEDEKYDINNGLLLSANADALFNDFYITVDEDKKLKFSFLLKNNEVLKEDLLLNSKVFKPLLNDQRMKYMEWHRKQFDMKENERKTKFI